MQEIQTPEQLMEALEKAPELLAQKIESGEMTIEQVREYIAKLESDVAALEKVVKE